MLDKTTTDPLASYRTPSSALDGVWFDLDDAPGVRVRVLLPTKYNQRYKLATYDALGDADENMPNGQRFDLMKGVFSDTCIVEVEGSDVDLPLDKTVYGALIDEVWEKATAAASEEMDLVDAKVEKRKPT